MKRDSIIFYRSFYEAITELPIEIQGSIYTAIFEYSLNFNEVVLDGLPKTIFTLIKPQLDANNKRYKNGLKGGRNKQEETKTEPKRNQNETKPEANKNVNDNVNKNINENDNDILLEKETKEISPKDLIEDDLVNPEIEQRKKVAQKKEIEYPFPTKEFKAGWDLWKAYRKKKDKFQYFDEVSEQKALTELFNLSKQNQATALAIIRQSIDKGWKGFFELKNKTNGNNEPNSNGTPNLAFARRR